MGVRLSREPLFLGVQPLHAPCSPLSPRLLAEKRQELLDQANKLRTGLFKIDETREKVEMMSVELEEAKKKVADFQKQCEEYLVIIVQQKREADEQQKVGARQHPAPQAPLLPVLTRLRLPVSLSYSVGMHVPFLTTASAFSLPVTPTWSPPPLPKGR